MPKPVRVARRRGVPKRKAVRRSGASSMVYRKPSMKRRKMSVAAE